MFQTTNQLSVSCLLLSNGVQTEDELRGGDLIGQNGSTDVSRSHSGTYNPITYTLWKINIAMENGHL